MTCLRFNQTIQKPCRSTPGVRKIYIANWEDVGTITESGGYVTDIASGSTYTGGTAFFYSVDVQKETSSFSDELLASVSNGAYIYKPTVTFKISLDVASRTVFKSLSQATVIAVVETNDGRQFLLGQTNGLDVATATANSGLANQDFRGIEVSISGLEPEPYIEIDTTSYNIDGNTF